MRLFFMSANAAEAQATPRCHSMSYSSEKYAHMGVILAYDRVMDPRTPI
jgi:hypothetical protein